MVLYGLKMENNKKYIKNCPKCGNEQKYSHIDSLNLAIRKNSLCKSCSYTKKDKKIGPFVKNCIQCGCKQIYSCEVALNNAIKKNTKCNECSFSKRRRILTQDEKNNILLYYNNEKTITEISYLLNIHKRNVIRFLKENDIFVEYKNSKIKRITKEQKNKIIDLYLKENLQHMEIANIVGVGYGLVLKTLKSVNLFKDSVKIELTKMQEEKIKELYLIYYKNSNEIANELGLNKHFISAYLNKCGYRRNMSEANTIIMVKKYHNKTYDEYITDLDTYKKYRRQVYRITRQQSIETLLNYDKRGKSGISGAYQLDHKYSILEGFKNNVNPEIIGNIKNLEFIPWKENYDKKTNCSITLEELITI